MLLWGGGGGGGGGMFNSDKQLVHNRGFLDKQFLLCISHQCCGKHMLNVPITRTQSFVRRVRHQSDG